MINTPAYVSARFNDPLLRKKNSSPYQYHYRKWLQYYLDFCLKYRQSHSKKETLPFFVKKLKEKHQTTQQQKQASHAVSLYYELLGA